MTTLDTKGNVVMMHMMPHIVQCLIGIHNMRVGIKIIKIKIKSQMLTIMVLVS